MSALLSSTTSMFSSILEELAIMTRPGAPIREKLILFLYINFLFAFSLTICAFVVAGTAIAGFNIVLTAFLNLGSIFGAWYVIRNSKTPIAVGFIIGVFCTLAFLNMMNCVYWGQLSHCTVEEGNDTCTNPTAYAAVSFFSLITFLWQNFLAYMIIKWRGALINEEGIYHEETLSSTSAAMMIHTVPSQPRVLSLERGGLHYEGLSTTEAASPPPSADL